MIHKDIHSKQAATPVGAYPHAKRVGDLLFLSGIGPRNAVDNSIPGNIYNQNGVVTDYNIAAQTHAVFANIKAVLATADLEMNDLIDVTVFLTHMKQDFESFNQIYAEYFTTHQPTRTTIEISSLPTAIAIELKCIASFT